MTSLLAGHCVPFKEFFPAGLVDNSSGVQAGGSGLCSGPPTGFAWDASCAAGLGSLGPFGSPGYVGWTNANLAGWPFTVTEPTVKSGPALLFRDVRSKSRLKLDKHCLA